MSRVMKDSGVEWIGNIPNNWDLQKGKYIFDVDTGKLDVNAENPNGKYPFFTCSMFPKRIDQYSFDCEALLVAGNGIVGYTQYYKGKFDAYQRTYVLSNFKNVYVPFLKHYVTNNLIIDVSNKSVGSVIQFIKLGDLKNFYITLPSIDTQEKISNILDLKSEQIDTLISNQEQQIEKLKAYKQSLITEVVTKGLNPNAPMKDSGVEWIGQVNAGYKIVSINSLFSIKKDIIGREPETVLSITQQGIKIKDTESNEGQQANSYTNYQIVNVGDFAMNHMDLLTGWIDISKYEGVTSPDYRVFVLKDKEMSSKYFLYVFQSYYFNKTFYGFGQGVSNFGRWRLPAFNFNRIAIPIPSSKEQEDIADYLDDKCAKIDTLIEIKQKKIDKLNEYKKSLIYEYVTGKKEVY